MSLRLLIPLVIGIALLIIPPILDSARESEGSVTDAQRIEEICTSIEGVESCRAVVTYSDADGAIESVAIIYTGDHSIGTKKEIKEVVSTVYGVGTNRIALISQKK